MRPNPSVSVLLIAQGDPQSIEQSLRSLSSQSLHHEKFDIVLTVDDRNTESTQWFKQLQLGYHGLRIRVVYQSDIAGVGGSLADLLESLGGRYVVILNEGERLSSRALEALLDEASETVVPITQIVDSLDAGVKNSHTRYREAVSRLAGSPFSAPYATRVFLSEIVGRLIPREWFNEQLLSYVLDGEALLFNVCLALERDFHFSRFPAARGAKYFRRSPENHCLPPDEQGRLNRYAATLEKLRQLGEGRIADEQKKVLTAAISWQLEVSGENLEAQSQQILLRNAASSGLLDVSVEALNKSVSTLAVVANFAPYAGTAGIVAAKRIIRNGEQVDLISSVMKSRKRQVEDLLLAESLIREHEVVEPAELSTYEAEIAKFIEGGLEKFDAWIIRGARYDDMYSRAMVPHSHYLAAAIKRDNPSIKWTAEFSDPLSLTVEGKRRRASFTNMEVPERFFGWGSLYQRQLLRDENGISRWAELLAFFFADALLFTNENQLKIMLDNAPPEYREAILSKASVSHHPTLPSNYYEMVKPQWTGFEDKISLAYFGDFHSTRGMNEVIDALECLTDEELHQFRVVIFTDSKQQHIHSQLPERLSKILVVRPRLNYLEFLATLPKMDVLIVNDSHTTEYFSENPYLPSKVSDYLGSSTPIWAVVEPNSVLSNMNFRYKSQLGDVLGAVEVLNEISLSSTSLNSG